MKKYPLTPLRFVTHIFGHADWKHFVGLLVSGTPGHKRIFVKITRIECAIAFLVGIVVITGCITY